MSQNRRFSFLLFVGVAAVVVILFAGLPLARFSYATVDAQYVEEAKTCGSKPEYQVRFRGGQVTLFADKAMNSVAITTPDLQRQKYLLCGNTDTRPDGYVAIFFPGNVIHYVSSEDVADIVPRDWTDGQA
ncbi:MAG: hypothetical protein K8I30_21005 [Anaerolineae bacterium]|nr:hypothetical protein [Anaerolineae bacterium]